MDSRDLVVATPDGGDIASNSLYTGMLDVQEQMSSPVEFSSFESFNPPPPVIEESVRKSQLISNDAQSSDQMDNRQKQSVSGHANEDWRNSNRDHDRHHVQETSSRQAHVDKGKQKRVQSEAIPLPTNALFIGPFNRSKH